MRNTIFTLVIAMLLIGGCSSSTGPEIGDVPPETRDPALAIVATLPVGDLKLDSALGEGWVANDGGSPVTERGFVWSLDPEPTLADNKIIEGEGMGTFTITMEGLLPDQIYYARAYAINTTGTAYGAEQQFRTRQGTVSDVEGNVYYTQTIGEQIWMAENLRVTRYANADPIPTGLDRSQWIGADFGAYVAYHPGLIKGLNTVEDVMEAYGLLYNWYVVDDPRGICPEGWRVPDFKDWQQLFEELDDLMEYGCLKSRRTVPAEHPRWESPNTATDHSGWTALPGGRRLGDASWEGIGSQGHFHSTTQLDFLNSWTTVLNCGEGEACRVFSLKTSANSIRCVRDVD